MTEYDNTNRGAMFENTKKQTSNHPDHTGTINVEGVEFWLSSWVKNSKSGKTFFSLSIKRKEPIGDLREAVKPEAAGGAAGFIDDDVPF
jgi:uncharacterized protein (DUF736 family)